MNRKEKFFLKLNSNQLKIVQKLHELVIKESENISDSIKWGNLVYAVNDKNFAYIAVAKSHVNLGFFDATSLADPDKILEGAGKDLRHIKFKSANDIKSGQIRFLIRQSYDLAKNIKMNNMQMLIKIEAEIKKDSGAFKNYLKLPPSHRREYIDYIVNAKKDETREKRLLQVVNKLAAMSN